MVVAPTPFPTASPRETSHPARPIATPARRTHPPGLGLERAIAPPIIPRTAARPSTNIGRKRKVAPPNVTASNTSDNRKPKADVSRPRTPPTMPMIAEALAKPTACVWGWSSQKSLTLLDI